MKHLAKHKRCAKYHLNVEQYLKLII